MDLCFFSKYEYMHSFNALPCATALRSVSVVESEVAHVRTVTAQAIAAQQRSPSFAYSSRLRVRTILTGNVSMCKPRSLKLLRALHRACCHSNAAHFPCIISYAHA